MLGDEHHRFGGHVVERHVVSPKPPPTSVHAGHCQLPRNVAYHRHRQFAVLLSYRVELGQGTRPRESTIQ